MQSMLVEVTVRFAIGFSRSRYSQPWCFKNMQVDCAIDIS